MAAQQTQYALVVKKQKLYFAAKDANKRKEKLFIGLQPLRSLRHLRQIFYYVYC